MLIRERLAGPMSGWVLTAWILLSLAKGLELNTGGIVEGRVLAQSPNPICGGVQRGTPGEKAATERPGSVFEEYEQRAAATPTTAAGAFELAAWCRANGLHVAAKQWFERSLELDTNYAPARAALGHVRVGQHWVDARTSGPHETETREAPDTDQAARSRLLQMLRGIRDSQLHAGGAQLEAGRKRILDITDEQAVVPLCEVLSAGSVAARTVLVEALKRFATDDATIDLAVLTLTDPDERVRAAAIDALAEREDPRIAAHLREALASRNDRLVRRAAVALQTLRYREATPELIDALTVERKRLVEIPVRRYFADWQRLYRGGVDRLHVRAGPQIAVGEPEFADQTRVDSVFEARQVTVFRTEVLEALKLTTGANHGFDAAAWRRWQKEQQQ